MSFIITDPNADYSALPNAPILPRYIEKDGEGLLQAGLKGLYLFVSGKAQASRIDLSGNGNHLTQVGSPLFFDAGYVRCDKSNYFNTNINEAVNQTIITIMRPAQSEAQAVVMFGGGNYNNDVPANRNGSCVYGLENEGAETLAYKTIHGYVSGGTNLHFDSTIISLAFSARTAFRCFGIATDSVANHVRTYDPLSSSSPKATLNFASFGSTALSGRRLTDNAGTPNKVFIGSATDNSVGACEIMGMAYYDTAITTEQFISGYDELQRIVALTTGTKTSFII